MRLRRLDLTRYGKFTGYTLDFGEHKPGTPDFHIVYGLNEAGKSTALSAWLDLLFEIEERTSYAFLHQGKAMEIGACLEFDGRSHEFRRIKQRSHSLLDGQGQPVNEAILSVALAGLTRNAYKMMFSLDDNTLEEGGNAILESKGDLGELLFSASTGLAGINAILQASADEADTLFRKRASSTRIAVLKREMAELKTRREETDMQASAHRVLAAELQQAKDAYDEIMRDIGVARARQDEIARLLRAQPLAARYHQIEAELAPFAGQPHPPAEWTTAVVDLIAEDTRLHTRKDSIRQSQDKLRTELGELVVDNRLIELANRIDQLKDLGIGYAAAEKDLPKRIAALAEWQRKADLILATLGKADVEQARTLLVPAATIGTLNDLIAEKSGIDATCQSAATEHEAARQALEKATLARQALDTQARIIDETGLAQLQTILNRLRQGDLIAEQRLAARRLPDRQQAAENAMAALHPWTGDGEALRRIAPVAASRLEQWKSALQSLDKTRLKHIEKQGELAAQRDENAAGIKALHTIEGVIDDDEAAASLAERDRAWAQHLATMNRDTALQFEDRMRRTDAAAAARLDKARQVAELRGLTAALETAKAAYASRSEALAAIEGEYAALRREIRSEVAAEIALDADAPLAAWLARIEQWQANRQAALGAWDELQQARRDIEAANATLASEQTALGEILTAIGLAAGDMPLTALVQACENAVADSRTRQSSRREADNRINELKMALAERGKALDKSVAAEQKWRNDWSDALAGTWFSDRHDSVGAVRELLAELARLPEVLREIDELQHRIEAMQADRQEFIATVAELNDALDNRFDGKAPPGAAEAMTRLVEDARKTLLKRSEREQALANLEEEHAGLAEEIAIHTNRKQEMTGFFDVETLGELRAALELCQQRDALARQKTEIEQRIIAEMQQSSLDHAMASLAEIDMAALRQEQAELTTRLDDLERRSKELFADQTRAGDKLQAIGGDDAAARIEASRRTILVEMEDLAMRYLRLKTGSLIASQALIAYRDKHRSAMMNRASKAFRQITRGNYSGLAARPEKDHEVLIGLPRQGGSKLASAMSKGTRFQLYLALRLAGYEEFAAMRPSVPFIADDIMETFDEPRSEEVFKLFGDMAHVGQVIYLTHHRHLCEIAARVLPAARIHEIS